jgi:hypothetical protein
MAEGDANVKFCPLDGSPLVPHFSHKWPCMEKGGCGCPWMASCPACMERALKAGKAKNKDEKKNAASKERSALMQRSFESRANRLAEQKKGRATT